MLNVDASASIAVIRSDYGSAPLDFAAYNGHTGMVELLLEKSAKIEIIRSDYGPPLDSTANDGNIDVVRLLLEKGANIEAMRRYGSTGKYRYSYNLSSTYRRPHPNFSHTDKYTRLASGELIMASGIEIAGLVLGAFPLAIEGIKAYIKGMKTVRDMKHYR